MLIRDAVEADIGAVTEIYGWSVKHETASFELEVPEIAEMTVRWRDLTDAGFAYLVAVDAGGGIAGFAYSSAYRPRPAYAMTVECSVYVSQTHRRMGVARALVTDLMTACASHGAREMVAVIGDQNNVASIALHADLGFRHVGVLHAVGRKRDRWLDVTLMQCSLPRS